jgi:hypothetical protein
MAGFVRDGRAVFGGQGCTRRVKQVTDIDGRSESSETDCGLETDEARASLSDAKLGHPFVGLGYVRVDSKFWSAEERFQICCRV